MPRTTMPRTAASKPEPVPADETSMSAASGSTNMPDPSAPGLSASDKISVFSLPDTNGSPVSSTDIHVGNDAIAPDEVARLHRQNPAGLGIQPRELAEPLFSRRQLFG